MNSLLDNSDDDIEDDRRGRKDREITLGTTVVLGIFFALAVLCAVFFGFGYSVGAKRSTPQINAAGEAVPASTFSNFLKPAPGKTLATADKPGTTAEAANIPYTAPSRPVAVKVPSAVAVDSQAPLPPAAAPVPAARVTPVSATVSTPTPSAPGNFMVQVAAVSHQEDADLLVSTLKRRNYAVAVHNEAQDKLLHVQVGPYSDRKSADAMRQRLQADGFNAIVKGN